MADPPMWDVEQDADLWALLEDAGPAQDSGVIGWPGDEAESLEAVVRRHGGRLPGSDPRR